MKAAKQQRKQRSLWQRTCRRHQLQHYHYQLQYHRHRWLQDLQQRRRWPQRRRPSEDEVDQGRGRNRGGWRKASADSMVWLLAWYDSGGV